MKPWPTDPMRQHDRLIAALCDDMAELYGALDELLNYSGGADDALDDEYAVERAQAALAKARGEQ